MRGYGMIRPGVAGWIEKERPVAGPMDAVLKPVALAPCSSDTHTLHGGANSENLILGHEAIGEIVEVGSPVKKFKVGDRVVAPCCTPDWEQTALREKGINNAHDAGLMGSFKFLLQKDGVGTWPNCGQVDREYGVTEIISYKEGDTVQQILAKNGGQVDRVIITNTDVNCVVQALQLVRPNGTISSISFFDPADTISFPTLLWGLGMSDVSIKCGFCPGGTYRIEKLLELIRTDRCHPGKLLNYKFEGFDKIEEAFTVMDQKPRDLIKPYVLV